MLVGSMMHARNLRNRSSAMTPRMAAEAEVHVGRWYA
jgi:hypothetical protein